MGDQELNDIFSLIKKRLLDEVGNHYLGKGHGLLQGTLNKQTKVQCDLVAGS